MAPAAAASLVVQTSFLGDMVLTTPLISELARRGPVDVVATPASAGLLANHPDVRDVIVYDKRGALGGLNGLWRASRLVRARRDASGRLVPRETAAAYLAQGSMRSAALALMAGIRDRVGFSSSAGRMLYTTRVLYRDDLHHAERLWQLSARDGRKRIDPERLHPRLHPGEAERQAVDRLLAGAGHTGGPLIGLAPGSVWATKRWPYYDQLAQRLAGRGRIVLIGGPADGDEREAVRRALPDAPPVDAVGRLSLLGSAELIRRLAVLVTNDSAPQHLASAVDTPTVAIFGPTVPEFGFGPLAAGRTVLGHQGLACRPCDRHGPRRCPLGHWRCMRELSVDAVDAAVRHLIDSSVPT